MKVLKVSILTEFVNEHIYMSFCGKFEFKENNTCTNFRKWSYMHVHTDSMSTQFSYNMQYYVPYLFNELL